MSLKSQTIIKNISRRLPNNRPPTHPGEMLLEEFIKPFNITQTKLAQKLGVSYPRLNEIIKGRRSVTPDTALRLSQVLGMSPYFRFGLQQDWDLWHAMNSQKSAEIKRLQPLRMSAENLATHHWTGPRATQPPFSSAVARSVIGKMDKAVPENQNMLQHRSQLKKSLSKKKGLPALIQNR